jgi:RNA polymerase sigma-70 factor (ECF subfamily)
MVILNRRAKTVMNITEKTSYFNAIIADNEKAIRRVTSFYCPDEELLEDLYQEIVTNIWESFDSFKGNSQINTWIYRIAINVSILYSKKNCFKKNIINVSSLANFENISFIPEKDIMIEQLYALVEQLNSIEKALILLYLDKRSHEEIADITGFSKTNVGTKINRIVKKLKKINTKIEYGE